MVDFISNFLPPSLGRGLICFGEVGQLWSQLAWIMICLNQLWQSYWVCQKLISTASPAVLGDHVTQLWPVSQEKKAAGGSWEVVPFLWKRQRRRELVGALLLLVRMWDFWPQKKGQENHKCQTRALAPSWGFTWPWGMSMSEPGGEGEERHWRKWEYDIHKEECTQVFLESWSGVRWWGLCKQQCDLLSKLPHL